MLCKYTIQITTKTPNIQQSKERNEEKQNIPIQHRVVVESVFEEETLEVEGGLDDKERGGVDAEEEGGYGDDPKRVEGGKEGGGDQEEEGQLGESRM